VCPECIEVYEGNSKATLPCLHPICANCVAKKNTSDTYVCLFMREGLHCHSEYKKDQVLVVAAAKKAEICGSCHEDPAAFRCQTCNLLLCSDEAKVHPKQAKGHVLVPLPSAIAAVQNPCEPHKAVGAAMYCKQCDKLICNDCLKSHKGHSIEPVDDGLTTRALLVKTKLASLGKKCDDLKLGGENEAKKDLDFVTSHLATTTSKIHGRQGFGSLARSRGHFLGLGLLLLLLHRVIIFVVAAAALAYDVRLDGLVGVAGLRGTINLPFDFIDNSGRLGCFSGLRQCLRARVDLVGLIGDACVAPPCPKEVFKNLSSA